MSVLDIVYSIVEKPNENVRVNEWMGRYLIVIAVINEH